MANALELGSLLDVLPLFPEETEATIYARWEAWVNEGLTVEDLEEWVDTREGSHFFVFSQPGVREAARMYDLMGTEFVAATIAVWSWGTYLDAIANSYLVERLEATRADGKVTFIGALGLTIEDGATVGAELVNEDEVPREYEVTDGGTIADVLGPPAGLAGSIESTGGGLVDTSHFYVVTTVNTEGESTPPAALKKTLSVGGDGIVDLTWDAVAGATGYRVYHSLAEGGPFDFIAEVDATAYNDDGTPAPDATIHPPAEDTTGLRITLPVEATQSGIAFDANAGEVVVQLSAIGATSVTNGAAINGGTDAQTDETLLRRLLERFEGIGPGNIRAYKVWAGEQPGVGKVVVKPDWNGRGTVLVILLTEDGQPVAADVVEAVQAFLDPVPGKGEGQAPIGHEVTVVTAEGVPIDVTAEIEFEPGYSLDGAGGTIALRDAITDAIGAYFETTESGSEAVRLKVLARIASFEGVRDLDPGLELNGETENVQLESEPAQVAELGTVTLTEGLV